MSYGDNSSPPIGGFPVYRPKPLTLHQPGKGTVGLSFLSDLHIGAAAVDHALIDSDLATAKRLGDRILLGGDIADLILTRDAKRYQPSALHPRIRKSNNYVNAALDWTEEILAPYADLIDMIGPGNHEQSPAKHTDFEFVGELLERLYKHCSKNHQILHGGYAGLLDYELIPASLDLPLKKKHCKIVHWHGSGHGGALSTALSEFTSKLWIQGADVFWFAHRHHRLACQVERIAIPFGNSAAIRSPFFVQPVWLLRSGSYFSCYANQAQQSIRLTGRQSSYAADALMFPGGRGAVRLVFEQLKLPPALKIHAELSCVL